MAFKLIQATTFLHTCQIQQIDDAGKRHDAKLRVRFNKISRARWEEMTKGDTDDNRLMYDELVNEVAEEIDDGSGGVLSAEDATAAVRADLSLTGQVVDQGLEVLFGAAAKNARRSRSR